MHTKYAMRYMLKQITYLFNSNPSTFFFFFNSLSGCPIAAAEKLAMSQDKNQLDSPQTGQCLDQVHRYDLPLMSLIFYLRHAPYNGSVTPHVPVHYGLTFVLSYQYPLERLVQLIKLSLTETSRPSRRFT